MPLPVPTNLLYDFAAEAAPVAQAYMANQAPKAALVATAQAYATAHSYTGPISALVSAAVMGVGRYYSGTGSANLRGANFTHTRLPPRAKPMERAPSRLAIGEPGSASGSSTAKKQTRRAEIAPTGLEIVERPLRLQKTLKGDRPKSVWSSLRDMVTGKKVLKSNFSFKMTSERDQRGLLAIPIRHDGNVSNFDSDWHVGSLSSNSIASTYGPDQDPPTAEAGYKAYSTMLDTTSSTGFTTEPTISTSNVLVPRLNLPTLEQTSWDLNCLKLLPTDNLNQIVDNQNVYKQPMLTSVMQLGGSAVPVKSTAATPRGSDLTTGYPSANMSYARMQATKVQNANPVKSGKYEMPRFKTQLGGGSLKMRMCNQGTNSCTVEFVVVKVVNPYISKVETTASDQHLEDTGSRVNMTRLWKNLFWTVGYEHAKKVRSNLSYIMGTSDPGTTELMLEPISNPYRPWLPDSCFKAHYDNSDQFKANNHIPYGMDWGLYANDNAYEHSGSGGGDPDQGPARNNQATTKPDQKVTSSDPFGLTGGAGQKTPYRVVNRGHCTIAGAAERTVNIPFPGSNYDASSIQSTAQMYKEGDKIDTSTPVLMSNESYAVLVSINGSLQDIIEPELEPSSTTDTSGTSTGNIKVIGKAYTSSVVDFYCEYTENVYPSHCDYSAIPITAFNQGQVRGKMLTTTAGFPGKVQPMADAVPVVQAGVLRTGAKDRAGDNAGSR